MNKKEHCKGCVFHSQGKKDTKYRNWCCMFSNVAPKAVSVCLIQNGKRTKELK